MSVSYSKKLAGMKQDATTCPCTIVLDTRIGRPRNILKFSSHVPVSRMSISPVSGRNASTIIMIQNKDQKEIEADGEECGNKKLFVRFNRNGPQMADGEYIDMVFDGNRISYEEAPKQHMPVSPF